MHGMLSYDQQRMLMRMGLYQVLEHWCKNDVCYRLDRFGNAQRGMYELDKDQRTIHLHDHFRLDDLNLLPSCPIGTFRIGHVYGSVSWYPPEACVEYANAELMPHTVRGNFECDQADVSVLPALIQGDLRLYKLASLQHFTQKFPKLQCATLEVSKTTTHLLETFKLFNSVGNPTLKVYSPPEDFMYQWSDTTTLLGKLAIKIPKLVVHPHEIMVAIINKHLKSVERDVIACQDELLEAGFFEQAQL